jgi:hypothetical protein
VGLQHSLIGLSGSGDQPSALLHFPGRRGVYSHRPGSQLGTALQQFIRLV